MNRITSSDNNQNKISKETLKKIYMIGLDKETIKKRNAFVGEARKIYADPSKKNVLVVNEK